MKELRLIVIEDNDLDVDLVLEAARKFSYSLQIERFSDARAAIQRLGNGLADEHTGVLLDLNLPGGSGLEVLAVIRASPRYSRLPVVVMTSSMSSRDREAAEQAGVQGFVVKVNDYNEYVAAIGDVLDRFAHAQPPAA